MIIRSALKQHCDAYNMLLHVTISQDLEKIVYVTNLNESTDTDADLFVLKAKQRKLFYTQVYINQVLIGHF